MLFLLLIFTVLVYVLVSWISLIKDWAKSQYAGPFPLPIIGNALWFAVDDTKYLNAYKSLGEYGDITLAYILSNRFTIVSHPKYVEPIVSNSNYNAKGISYNYFHPWLGQGLLTSTGHRWRTHRKLFTPAFHFNVLQNFLPIFCKNADILVNKLKWHASGTSTVDLFPVIALASLDNVTESIMGVSVNAQKDSESQYVKALDDLTNLISTRQRNPFVGEDIIFNLLPMKTKQDNALNILHGHTRKVIETRRMELEKQNITTLSQNSEQGIKNKHAFLDLLLLSEIDGQKIDDITIREEVDTFMFEGHDTTTSGTTFALYCIAKNHGVQEKILEEMKTIFGDDMDRDPTYNELKEMKYLELVIKETLRLYPSIPIIQRLMTNDSVIADKVVRKNTSVIIDIFNMQRRPDLFDDPLEFRPERFNTDDKNPYSWFAFSAGPRNCIGQKFAMMAMKVSISSIIKKFKLQASDQELILISDVALRSQNGVHIKLEPRSWLHNS